MFQLYILESLQINKTSESVTIMYLDEMGICNFCSKALTIANVLAVNIDAK